MNLISLIVLFFLWSPLSRNFYAEDKNIISSKKQILLQNDIYIEDESEKQDEDIPAETYSDSDFSASSRKYGFDIGLKLLEVTPEIAIGFNIRPLSSLIISIRYSFLIIPLCSEDIELGPIFTLPCDIIQTLNVSTSHILGRIIYYPFENYSFVLGFDFGYRNIQFSGSSSILNQGTTVTSVAQSVFVQPLFGIVKIFDSGFAISFILGYEFYFGTNASTTKVTTGNSQNILNLERLIERQLATIKKDGFRSFELTIGAYFLI